MQKYRSFTILLLLLSSFSALVSSAEAQPNTSSIFAQKIIEQIEQAELGSDLKTSITMLDTKTHRPVLALNSQRGLPPASLQKIVNAAAILDTFGPNRTFVTELRAEGEITTKTLTGDLVLVGGGDPSFGPRFQQDQTEITRVFEEFADRLKERHVRKIDGDIVGDGTRYRNEPHGLRWEELEFGEWYSAEVSALSFNENCIDISWKGGRTVGDLASFRIFPKTDYVTLINSVRVAPAEENKASLRYFRNLTSNQIRARGSIPAKTSFYDFAAVHDPAAYAATVFAEVLERKGIEITGSPVSRLGVDNQTTSPSATTLATKESPPLSELMPVVLGKSQNLYAEVLFRELALASGEEPSFRGAADAVIAWLRQNNLYRNGLILIDGSGLSPINRTSSAMLSEILVFMGNGKNGELWKDSFAQVGESSLSNRFDQPKFAPLKDNLRAKTGYLEGVLGLAGYLNNRRGSEYVFSILLVDYDPAKALEARDLIDELVLALYQEETLP